jgi:hypothetical protein
MKGGSIPGNYDRVAFGDKETSKFNGILKVLKLSALFEVLLLMFRNHFGPS